MAINNPNDYNDEKYTEASVKLYAAVASMWSAGSSLDHIAETIQSALDDADVDVVVEMMSA